MRKFLRLSYMLLGMLAVILFKMFLFQREEEGER